MTEFPEFLKARNKLPFNQGQLLVVSNQGVYEPEGPITSFSGHGWTFNGKPLNDPTKVGLRVYPIHAKSPYTLMRLQPGSVVMWLGSQFRFRNGVPQINYMVMRGETKYVIRQHPNTFPLVLKPATMELVKLYRESNDTP